MRIVRVLVVAFLVGFTGRAVAATDEAATLLPQAKAAIARFLPEADLVFVDGQQSSVPGCDGQLDWKYAFQTFDPGVDDGHAVGGYVQYTSQLMLGGDCQRTERIVVDTAMAPILGYVPLARHGDLDLVQLDWSAALAAATAQVAGFQWQGSFEIYTPVFPGAMTHVYYVLFGAKGGRALKAFVDATSGNVTTGS